MVLPLHGSKFSYSRRIESSLETSRAKDTSTQLDKWFDKYKKFVSKFYRDQPQIVYNPDKSGFSRGRLASCDWYNKESPRYPHTSLLPHKKLECFVHMLKLSHPPFLVYPQPQSTSYDQLIRSRKGVIEYTEKVSMNSKLFLKVLNHFDKYACLERPVILLEDCISSHSIDVCQE